MNMHIYTEFRNIHGSCADKTDSAVCIILVKFLSSKGHDSQGKKESDMNIHILSFKFRKNPLSGFRGVALKRRKRSDCQTCQNYGRNKLTSSDLHSRPKQGQTLSNLDGGGLKRPYPALHDSI